MKGNNNNHKATGYRGWPRGYKLLFRLFVALVIAAICNLVTSAWFDTPKVNDIRRDNYKLLKEYNILLDKIRSTEHVIADADKQLMKGKIQGKNRVVARNIQKGLSENDAIFDSIIDSSHKD